MNNLSTALYLIDAIGDLRNTVEAVTVISATLLLISLLIWAVPSNDVYTYDDNTVANSKLYATKLSIAFGILLVLNTLLPSKETMYAIAASEFGEELTKTPTLSKVDKALQQWLDNQINEVK